MSNEHIIRLNNVVRTPNTRKANRAIFAIKQYVNKHTHAGMDNIRISNDVNEIVWARGMNHKVNKLSVIWKKKEDQVYVFTPQGKDLKAFEKPAKETSTKKQAESKETTTKKDVKAETAATEKAVAPKTAKTSPKAEKKDKAE
jgi:ribosomal protein L31E